MDRIQLRKDIYICSDGGAKPNRGSYASVLATDDRILVSISGMVPGDNPGSFRAEAAGMLAPLHYLWKLQEYYAITQIPKIIQITDSQSMITQIQEHKNNPPLSARRYMASEMDMEMQIMYTLRQL